MVYDKENYFGSIVMDKKIMYQLYFIRLICLTTMLFLVSFSEFKENFTLLLGIIILYVIFITISLFEIGIFKSKKFAIYNMYVDVTMASIAIAVRGGLRSELYLGYFLILGYALFIKNKYLILKLSGWIVINYSFFTILFTPRESFTIGRLIIRLSFIFGISLLHQNYSNMLNKSETLREKAVNMATFDPLTGLYNRRVLDYVDELFSNYNSLIYVAMIDIDDFKAINDTYGHAMGDEVLVVLANELLKIFDEESFCVRYGGEEFLVITQSSSRKIFQNKIEKIQQRLAQHHFYWLENNHKISFTSGISVGEAHQQIKEIIVKADQALYIGKQNGKNKIIFADRALST